MSDFIYNYDNNSTLHKLDIADGSTATSITLSYDPIVLMETPNYLYAAGDLTLTQYDKDLNQNWSTTITSYDDGNGYADDMAVDSNERVYLTRGPINTGVTTNVSYDASGNERWSSQFDIGGDYDNRKIAHGPYANGYLYIANDNGLIQINQSGGLVDSKSMATISSDVTSDFCYTVGSDTENLYATGYDGTDYYLVEVDDSLNEVSNYQDTASDERVDSVISGTYNEVSAGSASGGFITFDPFSTVEREENDPPSRTDGIRMTNTGGFAISNLDGPYVQYYDSSFTLQWTRNMRVNATLAAEPLASAFPQEHWSTISGQAVQGGSGVSGAKIYVIDTGSDSVVATTTSDSNGNWSAKAEPNTTVHVVAQYDDGTDQYNVESLPFIDV